MGDDYASRLLALPFGSAITINSITSRKNQQHYNKCKSPITQLMDTGMLSTQDLLLISECNIPEFYPFPTTFPSWGPHLA